MLVINICPAVSAQNRFFSLHKKAQPKIGLELHEKKI